MTLAGPWRKALLLLHVVTSVGFAGAVMAFLALVVTGAATGDAATMRAVYVSAAVVTWDVIVPLAWASLAVGLLTSFATPWGLVRHYWVIAKLGLTVIAVGVLMLQTGTIGRLAGMALAGPAGLAGARLGMIAHAAGGLAVLVAITALSLYKPAGMTALGRKAMAARPG